MSYNLLFIDVGYSDRYPTYVHKMNVIDGDYYGRVVLTEDFESQVYIIINMIIHDKPDKIIFDKASFGYHFYHLFMEKIKLRPARGNFTVDSFGLITYETHEGEIYNGG